MLKIKTFIIIIVVYIISFIAIRFDINLFYPFFLLKDLIYSPVMAIEDEVKLDESVVDGINMELKRELDELKELNDIKSTLTDFQTINALVIERNKMYWFNTITINKGKNSGIELDMAVISSNGLIGKVNKVSQTTSEIKLITTNDINSKLSVVIKTGEDMIYGIMSGYDDVNNCLQVVSTNKNIEVKEGSLVYTSGMGGVFPSGILIGKVNSIKSDKYDVSKVINVKPSSNFNNFKFVAVLKRE